MKFSLPHSLPTEIRSNIFCRDLAVGERLFRRGDAATNFFIVESGRIRLVRPTIANKTATLEFVESGDIVGESAFFAEAYSFSAIAMVASRVIVYPKIYLTSILQNHSELVEDLLRILINKIQYFQTNIELREIRTAQQRVLQYLNYAAESDRNIINLDRPLQDIAVQLGLTPATLSRTLSKLEIEGSITREPNTIILNEFPVA